MSMAVHFDSSMSDAERRKRLYAGDIFIFSPTPGSRELINLAAAMLEEGFAPVDPRHVDRHMTAEEVNDLLKELKPNFIHHPECKRLIRQMMEEHGIDLNKLYFDVPRMRSVYPGNFFSSGIAYTFHPHRDTWYSAPTCQIN